MLSEENLCTKLCELKSDAMQGDPYGRMDLTKGNWCGVKENAYELSPPTTIWNGQLQISAETPVGDLHTDGPQHSLVN